MTKKLIINFQLQKKLEQAALKLGKFSAEITSIPDMEYFIRSCIKKESVKSSQIEGTQTQIDEAYQDNELEIVVEKKDDWREMHQYTLALEGAIEKLKVLPVSGRLIRDIHKILLSQSRGENKFSGEYRRSQNWIGGSRPNNAHFVPPSPEIVPTAMGNLEQFIHDESLAIPNLIKVALIHYQFETIHPFLDGNGRMGRILIPLYLLEKKILELPILYISEFFEENRSAYHEGLNQAHQNEEGLLKWVDFFLEGVIETLKSGLKTKDKIIELQNKIIQGKLPTLGRRAKSGTKLINYLFHQPIVDSGKVRKELELSSQTIQDLLADFVNLGVLKEVTGQRRNRLFVFEDYLALLR